MGICANALGLLEEPVVRFVNLGILLCIFNHAFNTSVIEAQWRHNGFQLILCWLSLTGWQQSAVARPDCVLNVLIAPDFWITLISILVKAELSTFSPRNTSTCAIYQGKTPIMTRQHWANLYHMNTAPVLSKEAENMSIDIHTLHQCMGHISMDQIHNMVKEGQLQGIQHLTGKLEFCEPCTIAKVKKLPFKPAKEA